MIEKRIFYLISFLVIIIAVLKIVFHLKFWIVPSFFFIIGLFCASWKKRYSLYLLLFLFPFINSSPSLFDTTNPFNYTAPSLFLLSGIIFVPILKNLVKPGKGKLIEVSLGKEFKLYYLFLFFLFISFIFVCFRWSNITLSSYAAFGKDTLVSPGMRSQRISFASIFPVISLFIYFISPYIYFLVKKISISEKKTFTLLSYGYMVSVLIGFLQKIFNISLISDRLGKDLKQFYGGFSDFNAFGFFSGVMFLWASYEIKKKNVLGYVVFFISLAGGILSGSRTVFFFIVAGIINLFLNRVSVNKSRQKLILSLLVLLVLVIIVLVGGTLKERISEGFLNSDNLIEKIDAVTNGRLQMTLFSLEAIKDNFISGIGTGNFTFYLDYKNFGKNYLYDLTLNQYTLIFTENGIFAFVFFTAFLLHIFKNSNKKLLIGMILFSLILNNYFWFPEAFLLFWVLAALCDIGAPPAKHKKTLNKKLKIIFISLSVIIFFVSNVITLNMLHPKTWAKETNSKYDYGLWYQERDENGNEFYWTKKIAGIFLILGKDGESSELTISCGAPLSYLKYKKQKIELYWRGKLYTKFVFTENSAFVFKIKSKTDEEGFLEIKVTPTFNLKKMGLGLETRDLGVMLYTPLNDKE